MTDGSSDTGTPQCCVCDEPATHQDTTPPHEHTCDEHALSVTSQPIDKGDTVDVSAQCPYCDRSEKFDDEPTARAWMTTHILSYHRKELPEPGVQR